MGKAALLRRNILFAEALPKERIFHPPPNSRDYQLYKATDLHQPGVEWPRYVSKGYLFDFSRTESIEPVALPGNVTPNLDECSGCYNDLLNMPVGTDGKVVGVAFHNASKFLDAFCTVDRISVEYGKGIVPVNSNRWEVINAKISKAGAPLAQFPDGRPLPRPGRKQWRKHRRENLQPLVGEQSVLVVSPGDVLTRYGRARCFIIDSGASVDATGKKIAEMHFPSFIREKLNRGMMNTANGKIAVNSGLRMSISSWDLQSDFTIMPATPELVSMGKRCWEDEYSFVWIRKRFPCFILDREGLSSSLTSMV